MKLPPRAAFTAQVLGTLFGSILNFGSLFSYLYPMKTVLNTTFSVLMNSIIDNQRTILLSVEGTNIWSGQQPQQYNSQAIAWGGLRCLFLQSLLWNSLMTVFTAINCLPLENDTNLSLGRIWLGSWYQYHSGSCTNCGQNLEPIICTPLSFGASNTHPLVTILMHLRQLLHWLALRGHQLVDLVSLLYCLPISMVVENSLSPLV